MTRTHDDSHHRPEALRRYRLWMGLALVVVFTTALVFILWSQGGARGSSLLLLLVTGPSTLLMLWTKRRAVRTFVQARKLNLLLCPRCEYPLQAPDGPGPASPATPSDLPPEPVSCPECDWRGSTLDLLAAWLRLGAELRLELDVEQDRARARSQSVQSKVLFRPARGWLIVLGLVIVTGAMITLGLGRFLPWGQHVTWGPVLAMAGLAVVVQRLVWRRRDLSALARRHFWLLCPRCEYPLDTCVGYDPARQSPTPLAAETVTCPECGWGGRAGDVVGAWRGLDTKTIRLLARR